MRITAKIVRKQIKHLSTLILILLPLSAFSADQPNILYIMADDLGYADLSVTGRRDYETPNIDSIAEEGMRFTSAYANSAVCSATRTALITGRYQYRLRVGLEEPLAETPVGLPPEHPTIASTLRDAGYATAMVGKWHLGNFPNYGPLKSGYDHFWGLSSGGVDYFTHKKPGKVHDLWKDDEQVFPEGYLTDLLADNAIGLMREMNATGKPFFMSLHFTAPHWPWEAPEDVAESIRLDQDPNPFSIIHYDGGNLETYGKMVRSLDQNVGRVLEALEQMGVADNTIVVFTSDNGGERFSDVWPLTGMKSELLEGGMRVPALVRWPGVVNAGAVSDQPIMSMDWMPTFLAAAGGQAPVEPYALDGVDITPALRGETLTERPLFWRFAGNTQSAARIGDYKYVRIRDYEFLFNVVDDPRERANIKNREPQIFTDLRQAWVSWNEQMLPADLTEFSGRNSGDKVPDRYGVKPGKPPIGNH